MIDNHIVRRCNSPIVIGDYVWIGNRVTINKGSMIPNCSIVASNSLVNKDFSQYGSGILAGCPAKFISSTKRRIFSYNKESLLNDYFREHSNALEYTET
jgi:acetyltransferase-like isoleucine patch superfamily enzyme